MTPLKLTLKGFIGIRSGLGRDEITIDFGAIDGDLIAIVGDNGAGKSTLLDNMHPFRLMPSRAGGYAPGSFSYYDHTFGDALKRLRWEHEGRIYESSIVIKGAGKTKKQECYLHEIVNAIVGTGEVPQPVSLPDGTVSDGKTDTYDRCVEHILGSAEMFFTAAFACQGRKTLADYPNGDIKALMSDLLGLEKYQQLSTKAADVAKRLAVHRGALAERVGRAPVLEAQRTQLYAELAGTKDTVVMLTQAAMSAKTRVGTASRRLAEAQAASAEAAQVERHRETLTQELAALEQRAEAEAKQIRCRHQAITDGLNRELATYRAASERLVADIARANAAIESARAKIERAKDAEAAAGRVQEIDERALPEANAAVAALEAKAQEHVRAKLDAQAARQALAAVKQTGVATKAACESLRTRAGLIAEVPCQGTDLQGRCKLLAEANTAAGQLPAQEAELEKLRAQRDDLLAKVAAAEESLQAFDGLEEQLATAKRKVSSLENERRAQAIVAGYAEAAKEAAALIERETLRAAELQTELEASRAAEDVIQNKLAVEADSLQADLAEAEALTASSRTRIERERAALPPTSMDGLRAAEAELAQAEQQGQALAAQLDEARGSALRLEAEITAISKELNELAQDVARAAMLDEEIAHWTLLAKAMGRDGIIALCIDDAGPSISSIANDLLTACYGPRFSVAIETQEETKAGTMKEIFDIRVFDAEREDVKSIGLVSGGERIWINEAMTRAIALYRAQASGRTYGCLFSDESDGALSPEKKQRFVDMKRKVLEIGQYHREFFISHTPDVVEAADAVIDLAAMKAA